MNAPYNPIGAIVRVSGEGFDADQVTLPCSDCGLSEYSCECSIEEWGPAPKLTMEEVREQIARAFAVTDEPKSLGDGWFGVAA